MLRRCPCLLHAAGSTCLGAGWGQQRNRAQWKVAWGSHRHKGARGNWCAYRTVHCGQAWRNIRAHRLPKPPGLRGKLRQGRMDIALGPRVLAPAAMADVTPDVWLIELNYLAASGQEFA